MDENEEKYKSDGPLNVLQDESLEIAAGMKCEMNSPDPTLDGNNEIFLKRRLPDPDRKLVFPSDSAGIVSVPVHDEMQWREVVSAPEQLQCAFNTSNSRDSTLTKFKTEEEEDDDFVDLLHTSIEVKDEDPLNLDECEEPNVTQDDQNNFEDDTRGPPSSVPMTSRNRQLIVIEQRLGQMPRMEVEHKNLNVHANDRKEPKKVDSSKTAAFRCKESQLRDKLLICSLCSTSFTLKHNLDKHMTKHTGEKLFSCRHCSASQVNCLRSSMNLTSEIETKTDDLGENLVDPLRSSTGTEQEEADRPTTSGNDIGNGDSEILSGFDFRDFDRATFHASVKNVSDKTFKTTKKSKFEKTHMRRKLKECIDFHRPTEGVFNVERVKKPSLTSRVQSLFRRMHH